MSYTNGLDKPSDYFNTVLYTGDGTSSRSITGVGFQPSFVWNKNRSASANHNLWNEVTGITERLTSSGNQASEDYSSEFLSFDSDGVTITQNVASLDINNSSYNYVLWNWLAGGTASSNTDGSITSTVSANTTSGFSIVSYTGTGSAGTIGHGLGVAPSFVIIKDRGNAISWVVSGDNIGWNKNMYLNSTQAVQTANHFQDTAPTSSLMYLSTDAAVNGSGSNHIMYCFAEKKGFSKAFSYTGNGSTNGSYIHLGFKPAFTLIKRTDTIDDWYIRDAKRDIDNPTTQFLEANTSNAEGTGVDIDWLSNGFKIRGTGVNASGGTYIGLAIAENPFVTSGGIPTTAR